MIVDDMALVYFMWFLMSSLFFYKLFHDFVFGCYSVSMLIQNVCSHLEETLVQQILMTRKLVLGP